MKDVYTQEMKDKGELPSVGMECLILNKCSAVPNYNKAVIKYIGDLVIYAYVEDGERCDSMINLTFKPIDTRTDTEKAIKDIHRVDQTVHESIRFEYYFLEAIKAGDIHGVKWVGES